MEHVHEWEFDGWAGGVLTEPRLGVQPFDNLRMRYRCACGAWSSDVPTEEQRQDYLDNHDLLSENPKNGVHAAWHEFERKFIYKGNVRREKPSRWKWTGRALITRIEKWYESTSHKDQVQLVNCDDHVFSSSMLVLVDHRSTYHYMGASLVYIPQNVGGVGYTNEPSISFLYPSDRKELQAALARVAQAQKELIPIETKFKEDQAALHQSWKPTSEAEVGG